MVDIQNSEQNLWHLRVLVRYGLYPLSWAVVLFGFYLIWTTQIDARMIWGVIAFSQLVTYLIIEWLVPYEARWAMSWKSFLADLRFAIANGAIVGGFTAALAWFTITISGNLTGPAHNWHPALQLLACLFIFEAVNYTMHRAMHELRGPIGKFLWSLHAAHHLPPRLYIIMHAVFHPLNGIIVQGLAITLPIWLMGYDQKVVAMFLMINGLHGLISHFNVDVRMGWLNYIFVGPELHRYHHSADVNEAKNYGNTLSIYDWMFGTFVYRPGVPPVELGVSADAGMPAYERTFKVLALPFGGARI